MIQNEVNELVEVKCKMKTSLTNELANGHQRAVNLPLVRGRRPEYTRRLPPSPDTQHNNGNNQQHTHHRQHHAQYNHI